MKPNIITSGIIALSAVLVGGCGPSSGSNETAKSTPAQSSTSAPAATTEAPSQPPAPTAAAAPAPPAQPSPAPAQSVTSPAATAAADVASAKGAAMESVSQFAATAAGQADKTAASIGSELTAKATSLTQAAQASPELKEQVGNALQSLSAGKDASALTTLFQQAKQANLTPQQSQLVKDVGHLASAYVVQRNFSSVDGAQGDVATIVNSLRKGSVAPAVPALQSLAQNASLTSQQKDLLATVADQYAPGLKKATDSLKQGLQSLKGFGK